MSQSILDNLVKIKQLDSQNMLGSLQLLSAQVEQIYNTARELKIPANYKNINNVVVLGMGGSAIGTHVVKTLFADELKVPVEIINDYKLPKFVNNKSLVLASSYSGNTEEVVEAVKQAKIKKAKILVISAGGKLKAFAKRNKLPALIFTTENNPCGSPRMGLGYSIFGQLILFSKVGLLKISQTKIKEVVKILAYYDGLFGALTPTKENLAKQLAKLTIDKNVFYVGSEHLLGNVHIAANQMNENAKRMAGYFALPELNHHLLEGMVNPKNNKTNLFFIMILSDLYGIRVQKRYGITSKVFDRQGIKHQTYKLQEKDKLMQACEILVLGSYISYYSALLKNIDPTDIPFVDYFKVQMK